MATLTTRDTLTVPEVCAELQISRSTFYDWRQKGRAPLCIVLPNGSLRIRTARPRPVACGLRRRRLMDDITYDVRVHKTEVYKGKKVTTYTVRWKVARKPWKEPFRNSAQADSFRSSLLTAARKGEAFAVKTGRPLSWEREENAITWFAFSLDYCAAKWPYASPNHRRGIAEALTDATEALLTTGKALRRAACCVTLSEPGPTAGACRTARPNRPNIWPRPSAGWSGTPST